MRITQQFLFNLSKPTLFSKVLNHDTSFVDMIKPLSAKEMLSLRCDVGTILYLIMMSLHIVCGNKDASYAIAADVKKQVAKLLSETIEKSELILQAEKRNKLSIFSSQDSVSEIQVILNGFKSKYAAFSGKICKTLLGAIDVDEDVVQEDVEQEITLQRKIELFEATITAIKMFADRMNAAVVSGEITVQQVSEFLSYCGSPREELAPDTISIINRLYFTLETPELRPLMFELVSTFLVNFSRYTLDMHGRTALHYAVNISCYENQEEFLCQIIQPIIERNPLIVHELDGSGNNVIHYAVCSPYMNFKIVKYLYQNFPAMTTQRNIHGDTPLHIMAHTYFIYFARIYVMFNRYGKKNLQRLRAKLEGGVLSEIREEVSNLAKLESLLQEVRSFYLQQCLDYYRFLMSSVPLRDLLEGRNNAGSTVYSILGNNIYHIFNGNLKAIYRDFSQINSTLPIYDYRVSSNYQECVKTYFAGGRRIFDPNGQKNKSISLFCSDVIKIYQLISSKFNEISSIRAVCRDIKRSKNTNFQMVSLGLVLFACLFILNVVVIFKAEPVFGMQPGVYRSMLCLIASISFFTVFCVSAVLYCRLINLENQKLMEDGKTSIDKILVSRLDIKAIDVNP